LRRNPFFRGRFPGNITEILCPFINDFEKTFNDYESNKIDAVDMSTLDMGTMARARSRFGEDFSFVPHLVTFYLTFRVDRPPFDDIRVRRAFAHAIDKASFSNEATKGAYTAADGGFIPPKMPGHSTSIGLKFDMEMARKYLQKAGYPEGRGFPAVNLAHLVRTTDDPLVPFLLKSWREILNVEISSHPMEWADFLEKRSSDPSDLMVSGWLADYPDPDSFLRPLFHGKEGITPGRWSNPEFDLCIDRAVSSLDQSERLRLYQRADEILVAEETAIVPVYYSQGRMLSKPCVSMPRIPHAMLQLKEVAINKG
jgi:oligopeptide transport system substrate-binding protein